MVVKHSIPVKVSRELLEQDRKDEAMIRRWLMNATPCNQYVRRCLEAGQHVPTCRCILDRGHLGPCTSDK
jgi:hypothetical protein